MLPSTGCADPASPSGRATRRRDHASRNVVWLNKVSSIQIARKPTHATVRYWPTAGTGERQVRSKSARLRQRHCRVASCSSGRHQDRDRAARKLTFVATGSRPQAVSSIASSKRSLLRRRAHPLRSVLLSEETVESTHLTLGLALSRGPRRHRRHLGRPCQLAHPHGAHGSNLHYFLGAGLRMLVVGTR